MLEAAVDALKVPLMVLGGSGLILAVGLIVSDRRRQGASATSADGRDPEPDRGEEQR